MTLTTAYTKLKDCPKLSIEWLIELVQSKRVQDAIEMVKSHEICALTVIQEESPHLDVNCLVHSKLTGSQWYKVALRLFPTKAIQDTRFCCACQAQISLICTHTLSALLAIHLISSNFLALPKWAEPTLCIPRTHLLPQFRHHPDLVPLMSKSIDDLLKSFLQDFSLQPVVAVSFET